MLEPVGDQVLIDEIRALRRDLHMRPFEASRRVYVILDAHTMNEAAADALLKDLEEPPEYAVIVLVADDLGPLPETILSRCQLVPFRRLSEAAVRAELLERAPGLDEDELDGDRASRGRTPRPRASGCSIPTDARGASALLDVARSVYAADALRLRRGGARRCSRASSSAARDARTEAEEYVEALELTAREAEQRVRRAQRRAERDELLASLEELAWWYRDLIAVAVGADERRRALRPAGDARRGRVARADRRRRGGVRARARDVARVRGVQHRAAARARRAVRAPPRRARRRRRRRS